jgi:prepilin-type N-terminal cleavage/methylation domain-containing protein
MERAMKKYKNGFTMMEMLVVISIIGVLMAMLFPAIGKVRQNVKIGAAKKDIQRITTVLSNYVADWGDYPAKDSEPPASCTVLIWALEDTKLKGPYIGISASQQVDGSESPGSNKSLKDPWGNAYRYRYPLSTADTTQQNCINQGLQFQFWSLGPNGISNYGASSGNDDVNNW